MVGVSDRQEASIHGLKITVRGGLLQQTSLDERVAGAEQTTTPRQLCAHKGKKRGAAPWAPHELRGQQCNSQPATLSTLSLTIARCFTLAQLST